ncbi:hypothetical protein ACFQ46_05230 [Kineococcus sp. GCM10028916]|uniref:hypothetical protein n=1 Tax=Kineococcus sp. GCM10028916 TaxID=3273394 RepID=UPI0036253533
MSTIDETPDTAVRGAQTVAPVQASALLFAASILGEASYTPDQELKGTLSSPARVHEEEVVEAPVPAAAPEPVVAEPAPVVEAPRSAGVVPPVRVEAPAAPVAAPVVEPVRKGFFARLIDKLLGR